MPSFERGAYEPSDDVRVFDAADDEEHEEEGSRLPLLIVIGLLVFAAFAGVVWLAYTQGVERGREDAPRMIVAAQGPVKSAPANPGGTQNPYTGLKIYQQPAPADEGDDETTPAPTPAKPVNTPAVSPSLAPIVRPQVAAQPAAPTAEPPISPPAAKPAPVKTVAEAAEKPVVTAFMQQSSPSPLDRVATKPPAQLSAATEPRSTVTTSNLEAAPAAPPEVKPAVPAVPQAVKPAAAAEGAFVLQIGAYKSEDEASAAWKAFQAKHPIVGGYESDIRKVELGAKGTWYRLRIGSFADKDAAGSFCAKLKSDGGDCIPAHQ